VASDRSVNHRTLPAGNAINDGDVGLLRCARLEGGAQGSLGLGRLRQQQHARGVLVQPVDDSWPFRIERPCGLAQSLDEPVRDVRPGVTRCAVDRQARWLVNRQHHFIFVEHTQREARWDDCVVGDRKLEAEEVADRYLARLSNDRAIYLDEAICDQPLHARPAEIGDGCGDDGVNSPRLFGR